MKFKESISVILPAYNDEEIIQQSVEEVLTKLQRLFEDFELILVITHIDELKEVFRAKVTEVGAKIDPVSQTFRVFGLFLERPSPVLSGMSGSARFTDRKVPTSKPFTPKLKRDVTPVAKK